MVIPTQEVPTAREVPRLHGEWVHELETVMARAGVPARRRAGCEAMLFTFLRRCHALPQRLREQEVTAYIREQAEAGVGPHDLLELLEALAFFFESVLARPDLAEVAGHPF